jgi:DHA2 family multidrug resistance protein
LGINFKRNRIRLLFVPITTLSLSTLSGKNIGEGAAFTGMMRQLEAHLVLQSSLLITRFSQAVNLVAHLDGTKFEVQRLQLYKRIYVKRIYRK